MKIILIRHGESEGNVSGHINDDPVRIVNLTERGRAQAEAAALQLRAMNFAHVYASEFARAQQTAEILLRRQTCLLKIDARLNERRSGLDGLPVHVFHDLILPDLLRTKPVGGESFLEEMERLRSFLNEISVRHAGETVLAVSHEDPILAALALTEDDPGQTARKHIANCNWVELSWPAR